jgi:hypothetical protein
LRKPCRLGENEEVTTTRQVVQAVKIVGLQSFSFGLVQQVSNGFFDDQGAVCTWNAIGTLIKTSK